MPSKTKSRILKCRSSPQPETIQTNTSETDRIFSVDLTAARLFGPIIHHAKTVTRHYKL